MYTFLMVFFIILCFFLALFVLLQQGKGDFGFGSMGGTQMLFGGAGGQGFFEKVTWVLGAVFILGSLGLSILKSYEERSSVLKGVVAAPQVPAAAPVSKKAPQASNDDLNKQADDAYAAENQLPLQTTATAQDSAAPAAPTAPVEQPKSV